MRVCIAGAGAIGGFIGGRLALAGHEVTLIAKGEHFEALRADGLTLVGADGTERVIRDVRVADNVAAAGIHDIIVLAVKAHQIGHVARDLPSAFGDEAIIVTVQNGIPWWYFQRHGGDHEGRRFGLLDPDGETERHIPAERIIGCVAYPAAEVPSPGVVRHVEGDHLPIGELDGEESARARSLRDTFVEAGFRSRVLADIRAEIWLKAIGTVAFNPVSAITGATMEEICRLPETRDVVARMMTEAEAIANKLGITLRRTIEERLAGAERVGGHKTSMLQDVEAGRPLELEPLVGAVLELGRLTETPCPTIETIYACAKLVDPGLRAQPTPGAR